ARGVPFRRATARRNRPRLRSLERDPLRHAEYPRRDRLSEDRQRHRPDDRIAGSGRPEAASGFALGIEGAAEGVESTPWGLARTSLTRYWISNLRRVKADFICGRQCS